MILAVIPARGGSKGIPGKNLVHVCGKPLIAWTIDQAITSMLIDNVIVATDSNDIADVAEDCGAKVFRRSEQSATDAAASEVVLKEVAARMEAELFVFLQCTSPIRQPHDIDSAIMTLRKSDADSCFSARRVEGFTWRAGPGVISPTYSQRLPRQQINVKTLEENGSIYVYKPQVIKTTGRLGGKIVPYIMDPLDSFQVDEPDDIPRIEMLMRIRLRECRASAN